MSTAYCTAANIQNRLSVAGVTLRADDSPPTTLGDVIEEASTTIDEHCYARYTPENLALSAWIVQRATDIAAMLLCERRGNPAPGSVTRRYERAMEQLEKVRNGQLNIYDITERRTAVPTMSNQRVVMRPHPRVVTETSPYRSTGTVTDYPRVVDPADRNGTGFDYAI